MNGWLIYSNSEAIRNQHYIDLYIINGRKKGLNIKLILIEKLLFAVKDDKPYLLYDNKCIYPDFVIVRTIYPYLNKHFEMLRIPTFNSSFVSDICNDKQKTYQYLSDNQIKIMNTWFVAKNQSELWDFNFPVVVKPSRGRGGENVFLAKNEIEYKNAISKIRNDDILVQSVASDSGKDLRVYVIGKKIITAMLRTSNLDFRSNYCLGGSAALYKLSLKEEKTVNSIIDLFDFGMVGIDFVFDNGKIVFNEIEDVVGSRMVYEKTDIDLVDIYLEYILNYLTNPGFDKTRGKK